MTWMFGNLNSLRTLDLSNFNTSSVENMLDMFCGCTSLVSLNLNSFDTSKIKTFYGMLYSCNSIIYLNLNSFAIRQDANIEYMIPTSDNLLLCYNESVASKLNTYANKCDNNCFKNGYKLAPNKRECLEECDKDSIYKYSFNNICFKTCSEISQYLYGTSDYGIYYNYEKTKCIDDIPDGYYLNDTNEKAIDKCNVKCKTCNDESNMNDLCLTCKIENNYFPIINNNSIINSYFNCFNYTPSGYYFDNYSLSYKPCYMTCKKCITIGDAYNHQCTECIDNYYLTETNRYQNYTYYYYFDDLHAYHCTKDKNCPENKSKLIAEKGECIDDCSKDNIYTNMNMIKNVIIIIKQYLLLVILLKNILKFHLKAPYLI